MPLFFAKVRVAASSPVVRSRLFPLVVALRLGPEGRPVAHHLPACTTSAPRNFGWPSPFRRKSRSRTIAIGVDQRDGQNSTR
jgi:hypothetical protein